MAGWGAAWPVGCCLAGGVLPGQWGAAWPVGVLPGQWVLPGRWGAVWPVGLPGQWGAAGGVLPGQWGAVWPVGVLPGQWGAAWPVGCCLAGWGAAWPLKETVKRKLESAGSPGNGFSDGFPPNKKACLENTGSPLDSKLGLSDVLNANGNHGNNNNTDPRDLTDFHRKEMKQEPDDMLPIMPPSGNNNSLFPDLNLNEQEWTELMEELNCSVAYEDIQDILNDGFEDRKDPLEIGGGASLLPLIW
ncbi:hypothetical protein JOQ06_013945 [Pogonophryne albipinna]|uniref:Uncharacterized protein n=1 Tax=Pogonophryne albipinna TaxID=1090488 RepID=A0AAD6F2K4_9TELE|nr:hypothetical protein JOQ06_013945 [Pogonophryne albipinna]